MCYKLNGFILHEGVLISASNYFTLFYMISSSIDIIVVCYMLSQFAVKIPERFASQVGSRQTLPMRQMRQLCYSTARKVHFTLVLLRAKSFQIGLNHSCSVFGSSSHIVLYHINTIYCISGLNCIGQLNAHCCYVLAYPIFSNSILFNACQVNFIL